MALLWSEQSQTTPNSILAQQIETHRRDVVSNSTWTEVSLCEQLQTRKQVLTARDVTQRDQFS